MLVLVNGKPMPVELPQKSVAVPVGRSKGPPWDTVKPQAKSTECRPTANRRFVWTGSVYAKPRPAQPVQEPSAAVQRKLREARLRVQRRIKMQLGAGDGTGRRVDVTVQCLPDVEEPEERRPEAMQACTQTDLGPANYPQVYRSTEVPKKCMTGLDACTQLAGFRELVGFDAMAYPVMELLVADALEQATVSVLYEDDAAALRRELATYESRHIADSVQCDKFAYEEAVRRRQQTCQLARVERETLEEAAAYRTLHSRAMAEQYLAGLPTDVLEQLESDEYLRTADGNQFPAWLRKKIRDHCQSRTDADVHLDKLICDVITNRPYPVGLAQNPSTTTTSTST